VLNVAIGIFNSAVPNGGHTGAPTLNIIYAENSPPNNIISDAKNIHIPNLAL
jgi:hypothetical protein